MRSLHGWRPVDVTDAQIVDSGQQNRIELYGTACNADLAADVRETDAAVGMLIWMRNVYRGGDRAGGLAVTLGEPPGDRVLVDLADWQRIEILTR